MKKCLKVKLLILIFLTGIQYVSAQGTAVNGTVVSDQNEPLVGVTVTEAGTTNGVITDMDGKFSIKLKNATGNLTFSYVGFATQTIAVNNQSKNLKIVLAEDSKQLDEVIVVGYGVQKKANVSGSITSLGSRDLHTMSTNDASQALQGKAPVYISRQSGQPGASSSIIMRGVGTLNKATPLWIIDGVPGMPLDNFNEVESIQLLKDAASAAIYGIEAANGVVLVTTKKGSKGKIAVNYNGYVKVNHALGLPETLGTQGYIDMYKARWMSNNPDKGEPTTNDIKSFYFLTPNEVSQLPNTDWVDVMFNAGIEHSHSIDISGASDRSSYFLSAMYSNDEGTFVNTNYKKWAIKARFEQTPLKWLKFSQTVNFNHSKRKHNALDWQHILRANPAMNVYDDTNPMNTGYGYFTDEFKETIDWQGGNPLESADLKDHWEKWNTAWGNLQAIITPIKGLVWTTNLTGTLSNHATSQFLYNTFGGISTNSIDFVEGKNIQGHQLDYAHNQSTSYLLNTYVNYNTLIGKHDLGAMIGFEVRESRNDDASGYAEWGIPAQDLRSTALTDHRDGTNAWSTGSSYSLFGRITYAYDNRYLLTANFRNDASDIFAPGKRSAFFPSVSIGWNIANEKFFKVEKINDLKLRFGIGEIGNNSIDKNWWRQEYKLQTNGTWLAQKTPNKDVTWEKTRITNIGIDLGAWNNAFTATIDLYNKKTRDALIEQKLPSTIGVGSNTYKLNKGEISNKGIELALSYRGSINHFNYLVSGNISYNKNKVLNIGNASYLSGGNFNRTLVNGPVAAFWGYVADGLYQTQAEIDALNAISMEKWGVAYDAGNIGPGDIKFKDLNGDGRINDEDMTSIGNPWPTYVYGFNVNLEYKGFEFNMNWQGVADRDIYNNTKQCLENMNADWNSTPDVWNAWTPNNTHTSQPRLGNATHNYQLPNSYMVEDGSYLRLKNIQLGYSFGKSIVSKMKLSKLKIYVGVENALTFTKFKGGIKDENKDKIFDRFFQEQHSTTTYIGNGIGLHIVKEYVTMHHGTITVENHIPQGTIFTITLPVTHNYAVNDEKQDEAEIREKAVDEVSDTTDTHKTSLLIVEDNDDFRNFLINCLKGTYQVFDAPNGKEALEILAHQSIQIVISDVMMPEMDGMELCRKIKTDIRYSHIPVILLTARTADEHELSGLKEGADDYITKPFNLEILLLRIQKILKWTKNNHEKFKTIDISPSEITVSSLDEQLIEKAIRAVEENMDNSEFSVEELSSYVGMSRGHLYKKLIMITGKSPLEFIRILRVKRGKQLLEQSQLNVSQIAYQIGLSPKQFAKYFKEEFGYVPSEYIKNNNTN